MVVLNEIGCTSGVKIVETRESIAPPADSRTTAVLRLGTDRRSTLSLICEIPVDPVKAILLADVLRIGRAALELERARQEERNRAAIWPALPIEEEAGALFLAEEMQELLGTVRRVAASMVPVLITGETGTGKEVLARTLHLYSTRAASTFLPFNCSSIHKDMLESQLFGHRRGSFTGATDNFPGVIRAASGGTLFLDEIAELSLDVQPKLLRFLESNEIHPMGDTQPVRADVRLVAATNADLNTLVAQGRFREDLFYRLNIVPLHVPPLRERRIEIPALANHYLHKYALENRRGDLRLAEETMEYPDVVPMAGKRAPARERDAPLGCARRARGGAHARTPISDDRSLTAHDPGLGAHARSDRGCRANRSADASRRPAPRAHHDSTRTADFQRGDGGCRRDARSLAQGPVFEASPLWARATRVGPSTCAMTVGIGTLRFRARGQPCSRASVRGSRRPATTSPLSC